SEREFVPAGSSTEQQVAAVWREVLGADAVGIDDNFFDLGGNSLLLIRVFNRLCAIVGSRLSVVHLFEYPTVRRLAGWIDRPEAPPETVAAAGRVGALAL